MPGIYEDFDEADIVVLVGSNLAWCHPILMNRPNAAKERRGTRIVTIDPRRTATAEQSDLHLAIAPGGDVALCNHRLTRTVDLGAVDTTYVEGHVAGFAETVAAAKRDGAEPTGLSAADLGTFVPNGCARNGP